MELQEYDEDTWATLKRHEPEKKQLIKLVMFAEEEEYEL